MGLQVMNERILKEASRYKLIEKSPILKSVTGENVVVLVAIPEVIRFHSHFLSNKSLAHVIPLVTGTCHLSIVSHETVVV